MNRRMNSELDDVKKRAKYVMKRLFGEVDNTYLNQYDLQDSMVDFWDKLCIFDVVKCVLQARTKIESIKLSFEALPLKEDEENYGGHFVYGELRISDEFGIELENIISVEESQTFKYGVICDKPDTEKESIYNGDLQVRSKSTFQGVLYYSGLFKEYVKFGYSIYDVELFNKVKLCYLDDKESEWKNHLAASYRLYADKSYKLAFLMAFIGLDSLIEITTEALKKMYKESVNKSLNKEFKSKLEDKDKIDYIRDEVLNSELYKRLVELENPYRKLVSEKLSSIVRYTLGMEKVEYKKYSKQFSAFEEVRNDIAHGKKEFRVGENRILNLFKEDDEDDRGGNQSIDFEKLYKGLIYNVYQLICNLTN